ncbi:MAG: PilN domain-containing protein [Fimbriimonadaceae bacterium]|nr:PilN domain-containing protein [Fimbriimonadaceae bacterium]
MSPRYVVEWSSGGVRVADPASNRVSTTLADLQGQEVLLVLGRRTAFTKPTFLPAAPEAELRKIVQLRSQEFFPLPNAQLAFDVWQTDHTGEGGRWSLVAGTSLEDLRAAIRQLEQAGARITAISVGPIGSVRLTEELGVTDAIVVQNAADGIAIDVVAAGRLQYSRVVNRDADIPSEIDRTKLVAGVGNVPIISAGDLDYREADRKTPRSALDAIGNGTAPELLLELPENRERREKLRNQQAGRQALLMVMAVLALATFAYYDREESFTVVAKQQRRNAQKIKQLNTAKKAVEADVLAVSDTEKALKRAFEPAQSASDVIRVVTSEVPTGVWLTGLSFERGRELQVRGTAKTSTGVSEFVRRLTAQKRFRDVKLVFANNGEIDKTRIVQFSVSAFPVGNLPLVEGSKRTGGIKK